jgi:hypothetical protein
MRKLWTAISISISICMAACAPTKSAPPATANSAVDAAAAQRRVPVYARTGDGGYRMTSPASFEGIEEPLRIWDVAKNLARPKEAGFDNITDVGLGAVRMMVRYRGSWWDGDQSTARRDRQRAEVKGLGPRQQEGETFEYATTWRTDPDFTDPTVLTTTAYTDPTEKRRRHFCHIFQLKATDGSDGPPLVTVSVEEGDKSAAVDYWPSSAKEPMVVRSFAWTPGEWTRVAIRIKVSRTDGQVLVSVNGDPASGVKGVPVFREESTEYRPKWGLYRAAGAGSGAHDDWVEHRDVEARKF